jgi:hypothetical protein
MKKETGQEKLKGLVLDLPVEERELGAQGERLEPCGSRIASARKGLIEI